MILTRGEGGEAKKRKIVEIIFRVVYNVYLCSPCTYTYLTIYSTKTHLWTVARGVWRIEIILNRVTRIDVSAAEI